MQHSDVLAVSSLADKTFGKGFLSVHFITSIIESKKYQTYCLKFNKKLIGFVIWEVAISSEISNLFHLETLFFNNYFKSSNTLAKLNQIAINKEYRKKGCGELLFKESIQQLPSEVGFLTSIYWIKDDANAMKKLLIKNGFESIKLIPNYWYKDSIKKKYQCVVCGQPPCKCNAEIFAIKKPQKMRL